MKSQIKKILKEEVNDLFFRRRANELWDTIKDTYAYAYPCDYDTYPQFLSGVVDGLWESEQHDWIGTSILSDLKHFISNYFKLELLRHYDESCYSRDLFESEEKEHEDYSWIEGLEEILNLELKVDAVNCYKVGYDKLGIIIFYFINKEYYNKFPNPGAKVRLTEKIREKIEKFMKQFPVKYRTSIGFGECPEPDDIVESTSGPINEDDSEIKEYMQYRVDMVVEKLRENCDSFMAQFEDENFEFLSGDVDLCEYLRFVDNVKVIDFEEEETDRRNFLTIYVKINLTNENYYYDEFHAAVLIELENFIQNYFHTKVEILETK
jgi:hypothetical protein